jgi:hypothetical protein
VVKLARGGAVEGTTHAFRREHPPVRVGLSTTSAESIPEPPGLSRQPLRLALFSRREATHIFR